MKLLKQATYIRYVLAKLSKFVQISTQTSSDSFNKGLFENYKGPGTSFQAIQIFDKKCYFVMLHELAKFNH